MENLTKVINKPRSELYSNILILKTVIRKKNRDDYLNAKLDVTEALITTHRMQEAYKILQKLVKEKKKHKLGRKYNLGEIKKHRSEISKQELKNGVYNVDADAYSQIKAYKKKLLFAKRKKV